ncbi:MULTISPECIES: signal recognition particle-docking protein FtsY [unclassified Thermoanaerobacterium]|uniref:signal recognition particle-docking protein FtsY n=1 Tax=unclassified Thermoanaerobacterium TaxID=2622527 RepID=UPI000A14EFB4|nr:MULTISPECIES: signal recognition particle-docking protein FtsY [unclassified Thermoanaerobacterium]MDE4541864.1 signal recognition particle-docking protein FtsY [Thermoanaerobacterium sp. R66]ORX24268.1 signal recognition particle-docking protein FtsY [Thermoanaerobacterium sp. PSU-2]HHV73567.1 signal recognition particle-docking protein FtsY [Thermoanaerobacterium sp.]
MLNFFKKNKKDDEIVEKEDKKGLYQRLKDGLARTRDNFTSKIDGILSFGRKVDDELFEELEEILILADVGVSTTEKIIDNLKEKAKEQKVKDAEKIKELLAEEIYDIMEAKETSFKITQPTLILIVGVNGVGKTTTIGKLANKFKRDGKRVLLVAADTFRAAAIDQLEVWAGRNNCEIIRHEEGSDPASVLFDGIKAAKSRNVDVILCDTAGRLHNKKNLMEELKKIYRVAQREFNEGNIETFLVLDATTGQNAIQQAKIFKEATDVTGIILTKLDGTAKGGIVISIKSELDIPVRFIGVGEGIDDLQEFDSEKFVRALFE